MYSSFFQFVLRVIYSYRLYYVPRFGHSDNMWYKKFWEEVIAYFPLIRHGPHRKRSRCLATIRGIHRHTYTRGQQRDLITLLYFFKIWKQAKKVEIMKLVCNVLPSSLTSSLLGPNMLLSTLFSNTLSLCSSLTALHQTSVNVRFYIF
jgi:hypothetical protein